MINNFEKVRELLNFNGEESFYFIQIIKRRKDNPNLARDMKRVAEYYIDSMKYFDQHEQQIIEEASVNNARVYIHLNRRNKKKTAIKAITIIMDYISSGDYYAAKTAYTSACGKQHSEKDRRWMIDVDEPELMTPILDKLKVIYEGMGKSINTEMLAILPTKNGAHIICRPFRRDTFTQIFSHSSIHADSPTVLFIP